MSRIVSVMSVNGDRKYLECAQYAIDSFCRHNATELYIFTHFPQYDFPQYSNLHFIRYDLMLEDLLTFPCVAEILYKTNKNTRACDNYGRTHEHHYVSLLPIMADHAIPNLKSDDIILKLDCDAFFYGPFIETFEKELDGSDLYLVKRSDPRMRICRSGRPGVGFMGWRKGGTFVSKYMKKFRYDEQKTIQNNLRSFKPKIIQNQSMHIVYVQWVAETMGKEFVPQDAYAWLENSPAAYFHVGGTNVVEHLQTLDCYFSEYEPGVA